MSKLLLHLPQVPILEKGCWGWRQSSCSPNGTAPVAGRTQDRELACPLVCSGPWLTASGITLSGGLYLFWALPPPPQPVQ